ncbi:MAG: hypothetical protein Q8R35_00445 [bacterium]|nr:hypothetical protein [bacterium]
MKFFAWLFLFAAAFIFEASMLPHFLSGFLPSITTAVLVLGIAFQGFGPGFAFAGLAGLAQDAALGGGIHTFSALGALFAMGVFRTYTQWEDPLGRIGAVLTGLVVMPLLWLLGRALADFVLSTAAPRLRADDVMSAYAFYNIAFAFIWFVLFSWLAIRGARRQSARRLRHL